MKKLDAKSYREVRTWIYRNARNLELALWQALFENAGNERVLSALAVYQNEDGGFGNALEPDSWNPDTTPYTTMFAIKILQLIGFEDTGHPVVQGIRKYLASGKHFTDGMWLFSIPSNNEYAHAPWWTYSVEANQTESIGLTAEIAAYIITHFTPSEDIYQKAESAIRRILGKLTAQEKHGDMGLAGYLTLLDPMQETKFGMDLDHNSLRKTVCRLATESIERDSSKWAYYGIRPSNYISSPDSILYQGNEEIVRQELDYLIDTRPSSGVWGITWSWFDNNEAYPKQFAISENWWKSFKAIEKMLFLRNFSRLEQ